jgi:succinyl-diaminopimelate desuccinylase
VVLALDRRTNPEEDPAAETKRLLSVLDRFKRRGVDLDCETIQEGKPSARPQGHPFSEVLGESVREVTGKAPRFEMCPGLLETRYYAENGVPALAYGPGLLSVSHGPHEFVPLQNVESCALVYALTAVRLLGAS